ncbi:uncharacterized protein LOC135226074 [Macrobrachium nipponense]|uniref:uncharacterized protein LOC135226074 n=1 Tax=Macrobrachium nipponense TaxID=159736 RepID=UPI0030C80256
MIESSWSMAKTLVFLVGCIAFCSSARAEHDFRVSEDNEAVAFSLQKESSITLAFWTSDTNTSLTFEVEKASFFKDHWYYQNETSPIKPKMWHFFEISFKESTVYFNTYVRSAGSNQYVTSTKTNSSKHNLTLYIKSRKKIYWHQCLDYFSCYLPGPEGYKELPGPEAYTELALVFSVPICCVCITLIIALTVYFSRVKKSATEELEAKEGQQEPTINFGVSPRDSVSHESINSLYWTVT